MYRLGPLASHVIINLPHFQPIKSSNFAAQQVSQSENVADAEKCATYFKVQLTLGTRNMMVSHLSGKEHKRKSKPLRMFYCSDCLVNVSSQETLEAHLKVSSRSIRRSFQECFNLQGKPHLRMVAQKDRKKREETVSHTPESNVDRDMARENADLKTQVRNLRRLVEELEEYKRNCILNHGKDGGSSGNGEDDRMDVGGSIAA